MHLDLGLLTLISYSYWFLCSIHYDVGDPEEAQNFAERALELAQKYNQNHYETMSKMQLGRIQAKKDPTQNQKAEGLIHEGIKTLEELKLKSFIAHGYFF